MTYKTNGNTGDASSNNNNTSSNSNNNHRKMIRRTTLVVILIQITVRMVMETLVMIAQIPIAVMRPRTVVIAIIAI